MKNQYFGDVNDYRKYGLLRRLARSTGLRLGVCWMLTPNDRGPDGRFVRYLGDADRWRHYDPNLFDSIRAAVTEGRHVGHAANRKLVPAVIFIDEEVTVGEAERTAWFNRVQTNLDRANAELVFFDPDNGIEVPSCPLTRRKAAKYLLWREIGLAADAGRSLLVYQHFSREKRSHFVERLVSELERRTGCHGVQTLCTANVAFFLIPLPQHRQACAKAVTEVVTTWPGQIWLADPAGAMILAHRRQLTEEGDHESTESS